MSTEQEDAVLLLELEEKITNRIREQIFAVANKAAPVAGTTTAVDLRPDMLHRALAFSLLNDPVFMTEVTKRVGQRMTNIF